MCLYLKFYLEATRRVSVVLDYKKKKINCSIILIIDFSINRIDYNRLTLFVAALFRVQIVNIQVTCFLVANRNCLSIIVLFCQVLEFVLSVWDCGCEVLTLLLFLLCKNASGMSYIVCFGRKTKSLYVSVSGLTLATEH